MNYIFIFSFIIFFTSRDLFNFKEIILNDSHILCAMLMLINEYSMQLLFIIALILYSFSRFSVQFTIIDLSSKKLFSKLQASIFIIFISFISAASVAEIILFSIHFDCRYLIRALLSHVRSC